ncbi:hypothetical protein DH2020_018247 [Rehmannia glutinosa]|uniref:Alpha/beta hydrolase fold-3 domain-containing protein n=1 Tax=Rehmannia glutinosa TaxID=99300 RepID=A0ABR0WJI4_REHGL
MGSLPHVVEDCLGIVQVFSDGSISRSENFKVPIKVQDDGSAVWKDCLFDKKHNLHLRLYKPRSPPSPAADLPVLFFFHGGGFCVGSRTWPNCHSCCLRLASALQVLVVAPDYRLAPEHRLPAAMDDAMSSVKWLQSQALLSDGGADDWLREGVDFGRVFVVGDSSGGNMAHHLAVELRRGSPGLEPVRVRVGGSEVMKDRIEEYSKRLKEMGKEIEYVEYQGEQHGFFTNQPFSQVANKKRSREQQLEVLALSYKHRPSLQFMLPPS